MLSGLNLGIRWCLAGRPSTVTRVCARMCSTCTKAGAKSNNKKDDGNDDGDDAATREALELFERKKRNKQMRAVRSAERWKKQRQGRRQRRSQRTEEKWGAMRGTMTVSEFDDYMERRQMRMIEEKEEAIQRAKRAMAANSGSLHVCLHLGFENIMEVREQKSLVSQVSNAYGYNKKSERPCRITLTNYKQPQVIKRFDRVNANK